MSKRVQQIDSLTRPDHFYLDADDVCYYAGEYTAGEGHAFSETNQLVLNFKKSLETRDTSQWRYKEIAINKVAAIFRCAIKVDAQITFVPVPPSKAKHDPLYDDRMDRMLDRVCDGLCADVRELVIQKQTLDPFHLSPTRPRPDDLIANYEFDSSIAEPAPTTIIICDDVITTGSHFKAIKHVLKKHYPNTTIAGLFLARRVPKSFDLFCEF